MEKFNKAQAKNLAAAKKLVDTYASSSEDEGELDEKHILDLLYKHYKPSPDNSSTSNNANRTATFLENSLHSGAATCLICIGSIRRVEGIWSCKSCYCFFHLKCIQRWANDSVMQMKVKAEQQNGSQGHYNHLGEFVPPKRPKSLHWCCPQCRTDYQPADRPTQYECFCGKEVNPQAQPFLVPHSCGEICGKLLQPKCGHDCKLLCHPGPCPPCAQLAQSACLCGKSAPRSVRCIDKNWQCQQMCQSLLSCGKHKCNQRCHRSGQCPPCSSKSSQYCDCKREQKVVNCAEPKWKCKNICGALFDCGLHSCDKVCHAGPCGGECPLGVRSCPCGKSVKTGGCSEVLETCGDTCQKVLSCGKHSCAQRCHRGPCNLCLVRTTKKCRCGQHEKELPCSKDFTCETKCKLIRDCNKHACNRKCCGDQCPPCEKICGKQLSCNKHKCQSVCHNGPCYPCKLESQVNCRCGKTRRSVPCGREKSARIVCQELCRISAKCHHAIKHRCHKGECPPCAQQCGLPNDISGCGHICKVRCHAAIRVPKPADAVRPHANKYEYRAQPHPRCEEGISVTCIGGHEIATWPCWNSKPQSCARKCGRQLKCGNHKCQLFCHAVPNLMDMQQQVGCSNCDQGCAIARPAGCTHACAKGCHPPPCAPCSFVIKNKCHCGLNQVIYKCSEFFNQEGSVQDILDRRQKLCSCGNRCLKNFACGHRCMTICHPGPCPNPDMCRKKLKIYCACKRIKLEIACDKHRAGQTSLECDDNCQAERVKAEALEQQNEDRRMRYVEERNQRELERFKQLFAKRKPKERKAIDVPTTKSNIDWKRCAIYAVALFAALGALAVAYYAES